MNVLEASVERARNGDRAAFNQLARNYQQRAIYVAYCKLRDFQLAEDVAQEALMEAYERITQLRSPKAFPLWLSRIVRTKARMISERQPKLANIESTPVADPRHTVEQLLERELICRGVRNSLIRLPEHQRGIVKYYYFQNLRQADICHALNLPLTTVAKRLHDARAALRRIIGNPERLAGIQCSEDANTKTTLEEESMGTEESKAVIQRWQQLHDQGRSDEIVKELISLDVVHHARSDLGYDQYVLVMNKIKEDGVKYHLADMIAEGDRVAVWWVKEGEPTEEHPKNYNNIYRIVDGKIVESINTLLHYR